ncbi:hypothetical protein [Sphingomonas aerolata]|uniref:hypothetical protein n=1 Tax=Sphingomonas aerolata TaxID=185951 RepID=UPI002FE16FA2
MSVTAEEAYARSIARLALRVLALTAVDQSEVRGAVWDEFEDLNGAGPLSRIPASRMKGDLERKAEWGGDHLVPFTRHAIALLRALGRPPAAAGCYSQATGMSTGRSARMRSAICRTAPATPAVMFRTVSERRFRRS